MVRFTTILCRVPVIKFRKGGGSSTAPSSATPVATPPVARAPAPAQAQPAAAMSTAPISDIDLPLRYRRQPLSQEEIDYINGGGVV